MYIQRNIEKEIEKYLETKEILALIGPRQSGKTTVLNRIFNKINKNPLKKEASFITFEDRDVLALFNEDIKNFAETYLKNNDFLFIDEFQYAKEGGKNLKYLFDTFNTKIIISGSSAIDLTIKVLRFLVGRVFVLEMKPFDFGEFLLAKDKNYHKLYLENRIDFLENKNIKQLASSQKKVLRGYFEEYAVWGGYPRVVLSKSREEKEVVLKNIYNTYFLREVKSLMDIADDYQLEKVIKLLGLQIGNLLEYDNLGNETDISFITLKKYINFLEKTYICKLIKPFYKNKRKEIVKIPKVFFFDTGLRNVIVKDFRLLNERVDAGELLENAVWMQLNRRDFSLQYWRDKNKNEVDFVLEIEGQKLAVMEVKKNRKRCKCSEVFAREYSEAKIYCGYLDNANKTNINNNSNKDVFIPML